MKHRFEFEALPSFILCIGLTTTSFANPTASAIQLLEKGVTATGGLIGLGFSLVPMMTQTQQNVTRQKTEWLNPQEAEFKNEAISRLREYRETLTLGAELIHFREEEAFVSDWHQKCLRGRAYRGWHQIPCDWVVGDQPQQVSELIKALEGPHLNPYVKRIYHKKDSPYLRPTRRLPNTPDDLRLGFSARPTAYDYGEEFQDWLTDSGYSPHSHFHPIGIRNSGETIRAVSVNHKIVPLDEATIPVTDRVIFGHSVYEVIRTYGGGKPFHLEDHYSRLRRSGDYFGIEIPFSLEQLRREVFEIYQASGQPEIAIRIVVTGGAPRNVDLVPGPGLVPNTILYGIDIPKYPQAYYSEGISIIVSSVLRNDPRANDPAAKTGTYAGNSMRAWKEALARGADYSVMPNSFGNITEGPAANVFMVKNGEVYTPDRGSGILEGVTRGRLFDVMEREGILYHVVPLSVDFFRRADEIFLTGTTVEVLPVTTLEGRRVGSGRPGPMTRKLIDLFRKEVETWVLRQG